MHFFVSAYSMSPCGNEWNEQLEGSYIDGLKTLPFVAGIELPQFAELHRWDEAFFFRQADPSWSYLATALPTLSNALRDNPAFGLSANDDAARRAAIDSANALRTSVMGVHDRLGRQAIQTVELHSGSAGGRLTGTASAVKFADSLAEIAGWDWDGAELVVEHCDAALPGQAIQKGFLTVEEEIEAILLANGRQRGRIGASLNWARSAIEGRSRDTVPRHAALLQAAGLLRGICFSGCSGADTPFGVWQDTHMPHGPESYISHFAEGSLLTEREMRALFAQTAATDLAFTGLKIAIRPTDAPVAARIALLRDGLLAMASAALAVR